MLYFLLSHECTYTLTFREDPPVENFPFIHIPVNSEVTHDVYTVFLSLALGNWL